MAALQITGLEGDKRNVDQASLDPFSAGLEGSLIYPDDEGFADATLL